MSGPWIDAGDTPGFMAKRTWSRGEILERRMYDADKQEQRKALWRVIRPGHRSWPLDGSFLGGCGRRGTEMVAH